MNPFKQESEIEVSTTSGMLRISVHPRVNRLWMIIEIVITGTVAYWFYRGWSTYSTLIRIFAAWCFVGAIIAWFYKLSGSELIEIDDRHLTIRKTVLGWERTSEYPTEDCRGLQIRERNEDEYGLQCKVGWRTVPFGEYISEAKAEEILTLLQRDLPTVADRMLLQRPDKEHFTTLRLN